MTGSLNTVLLCEDSWILHNGLVCLISVRMFEGSNLMHVVVEYILATTTIMERLSSYPWLEATLLDRNRHGTFHLRNPHWIALFIHERHTDFIKVCVVQQLIVVMEIRGIFFTCGIWKGCCEL